MAITLYSARGELPRVSETKCISEKVGSPPKVMLPSKRVTLHPGSPGPPSQLRPLSCKRFAAIHKEMYEKFYRLGWLGKEGNPPTRDNSPPYKQALMYYASYSNVQFANQSCKRLSNFLVHRKEWLIFKVLRICNYSILLTSPWA